MHWIGILILITTGNVWADDPPEVGEIEELRGTGVRIGLDKKEEALEKGSDIREGDLIKIDAGGYAKIEFDDETIVQIGPRSKLRVKRYQLDDSRHTLLRMIQGKFRTKVNNPRQTGEKLLFTVPHVPFAVRGTEFLTNAYLAAGQPTSDIAVIEGSVQASGKKIGGQAKIILKSGQALNSNHAGQIKSLSQSSLEVLRNNPQGLLPNMQSASGKLVNLDKVIPDQEMDSLALDDEERIEAQNVQEQLKGSTVKVHGPEHGEDFHKLPWDIKDAIRRREEMRRDGSCFYWFYKSLPGAGKKERFRRERDCDDYQED